MKGRQRTFAPAKTTRVPAAAPQALGQAVALFQAGKLAEAERLYAQLIAGNPRLAVAHNHLGLIAKAHGQLDRAEALLRQSIALDPKDVSGFINLGNLLMKLARPGEAADIYAKALALAPANEDSMLNLAWARYNTGDYQGSLAMYEQAAAKFPRSARGHNGVGLALAALGRPEEAEAAYRRAAAADPKFPGAYNNLGVLLRSRGRYEEACAAYRSALAIDPCSAEAYNNLGCALLDMNRIDQAKASFARALETLPNYADAMGNLGNAQLAALEVEQAIVTYDRAVALDARKTLYKLHGSFARMTKGDFARGWPDYEARLDVPDLAARLSGIKLPRWNGAPLANGKLLVVHEQGFGDTLQFLRFLAPLMQRVGEVALLVPSSIRRLVPPTSGLKVLEDNDGHSGCAAWTPLLSLPLHLGTLGDALGEAVPYLTIPQGLEQRWRERIGGHGTRVGLVWAGGPGRQLKDSQRSIPPELLEPLIGLSNIRFFSLQKIHAEGALAAVRRFGEVIDLSAELADFAETGAAARCMDLVISVDTSVLHLVGALGIPALAMLIYCPDWRWMLARDDSPWYPSLQLFRQARLGDWGGVVERVAAALAQRAGLPQPNRTAQSAAQ